MATLLLTTVGSALGGPVGGALGALAGRRIDEAIVGGSGREGPRLKELQVTTSSYGQPIPWHFGRVRAAGTVIWATDLVERRETSGGGKGKPKTTSFSYSASFAVALASRPIGDIGRIWADGNLLRGAAGDLKTGGRLRIHHGWGDQPPDPLIASAEGAQAPAFRNIAYVVFEDLQLADFGNRIPTLTFEIFGATGDLSLADLLHPLDDVSASPAVLTGAQGYSWDSGALGQVLAGLDSLYPMLADAGGRELAIAAAGDPQSPLPLLPEAAAAADDNDFARLSGFRRRRETAPGQHPAILRYYDVARDFQPGAQRALGRSVAEGESAIEFPGTLGAADARALIEAAATRSTRRRETLAWRIATLDPALVPGALVIVPGLAGAWRIVAWEWRDQGVELELERHGGGTTGSPIADPGRAWAPPDRALTPTLLRAFEVPPQSSASSEAALVMAAATSQGAGWTGAALYADHGGALVSLEVSARVRAIEGTLLVGLGPSPALRLEPLASCTILLASEDFELVDADLSGLALGQNRLLIGGEVIQFARAERIGPASWRLSGLLRGRGTTESAAMAGHAAGTAATLLDDRLVALDGPDLAGATALAAIGHGDDHPVLAAIENPGLSLRPPTPVHARRRDPGDGSLALRWTRRARGAWAWLDEVESPLVEAGETYRVGLGPVAQPHALWEVGEPMLAIDAASRASLAAAHPGALLWVRQVGTHAQSQPLDLGPID